MTSDLYGGFHLLTRYKDVRDAALDFRTYTSSVIGVTAIPVITHRTEPQLPIELDPPLQSRYRALVNPLFSKERIDALQPVIRAVAAEKLGALVNEGGGDFVATYAIPVAIFTLATLTGLPESDHALWLGWITRKIFDVG